VIRLGFAAALVAALGGAFAGANGSGNESRVREADIEFYSARAMRDPTGAADLAMLASLYLERGRATGDASDAVRAERAARQSLANRSSHNERALSVLSSSLMAQHRFTDALHFSAELAAADTGNAAARAAVGEIQMELGRYDGARATFHSLEGRAAELSVATRFARWLELTGHPGAARTALHRALTTAEHTTGLPTEQLAWYWLRLGDLDQRVGSADRAESDYRQGLRLRPDDYRLLSARAHIAAVRGRWDDAIAFGERAIAISLDPATLGTLSDSYAAKGDTARAAEYARALEVAVLAQPGAYHRAWSLFLLDHRVHLDEVHAKVRADLRTRRDIYGWDLYAWSLHQRARNADARAAMAHALALGTVDASLYFHAGVIESALGNGPAARGYLERALAANPYFHPTQPALARAMLDSLREHAAKGPK
jgi:tetratricopeptide (TPR) repeat protein